MRVRHGFLSAASLLAVTVLLGVSAFAQTLPAPSRTQPITPFENSARQPAGNAILIDPRTTSRQRADAAGALRDKAGRRGGVRVIVGLRLNWRLPDELTQAEAVTQTAQLQAAQNALVGRVVGNLRSAAAVRRFDYVPYVALNVNRQQLDRLLADPGRTTIMEDVAEPPTLQQSVPRIHADDLVDDGFPGRKIAVAILDTGVDTKHKMFHRKIVSEACYSTTVTGTSTSVCPGGVPSSTDVGSGGSCPASVWSCDHGTHVAGIAAGDMRTPLLRGVAPRSKIIAIQVNSSFSSDCSFVGPPCAKSYVSDQVKALERVYELRDDFNIAAVNMSLGGGEHQTPCDAGDPRASIIRLLRRAKIATVISSGNDAFNGSMSAPACISHAIAVGSTLDTEDTLSTFSNHTDQVRLLAPGSDIVSAVPDSTRPRDLTGTKSGTSMAAPHVTGAFALLRDVRGRANVDQISAALECTGVEVTRAGITERRIDVDAARDYLLNPPNPSVFFNFNSDTQAAAWTPLLGTWAVSGGRYQLTDITPGWKLSSIHNCHDKVTITASLRRMSAGPSGWTGMFFKSQISDVSESTKRISGYLALISGTPALNLWRYDRANLATNAGFASLLCNKPIPSSIFYTIKVITLGGRHRVFVNDTQYCNVKDYTYGTGRTGILTKIEEPAEGNSFYAESFRVEPGVAPRAISAAPTLR